MATAQQYQSAIDRLNEATTKASTYINKLREDRRKAMEEAGMLNAEEAEFLAKLGAVADALDPMGGDVTDPVPVPVPDPEPADGADSTA